MIGWNNPVDPKEGKAGKLLREYAPIVIMAGIPAALWILKILITL